MNKIESSLFFSSSNFTLISSVCVCVCVYLGKDLYKSPERIAPPPLFVVLDTKSPSHPKLAQLESEAAVACSLLSPWAYVYEEARRLSIGWGLTCAMCL